MKRKWLAFDKESGKVKKLIAGDVEDTDGLMLKKVHDKTELPAQDLTYL